MKLIDLQKSFVEYHDQCEIFIRGNDGKIVSDLELRPLCGVGYGQPWPIGNNGITQVLIAEHSQNTPKE